MMQVRPLGGSYSDSMLQVAHIQPTARAIKVHFRVAGEVVVTPYCPDIRNGWDTHLILVDGRPCGFSDGPVDQEPAVASPGMEYQAGFKEDLKETGWLGDRRQYKDL